MSIEFTKKGRISEIVFSTVFGIDGQGIFPLSIWPRYNELLQTVYMTGTTILGKSSTPHAHKGNFRGWWDPFSWKYIKSFGRDGMINCYGLTNPGIRETSRDIARSARLGIQIIPNIFPFFGNGREAAAQDIMFSIDVLCEEMGKDFWIAEISYSCPNTKECISDSVKDALWLTEKAKKYAPNIKIIAKISLAHPPIFAHDLSESGADVIHSANSIPYQMLFNEPSPYGEKGGGVSGGPAFEMAFDFNSKVLERYQGPIILGCGIVDDQKLERYLRLAYDREDSRILIKTSFSFCTVGRRRPGWAKEKVLMYN
jgi:dihydroorotate dehydrogenase